MRHATADDLEQITGLLGRLRSVAGLVERTPGVFYRRSRAFLHFHEDAGQLFADVRLHDDDFVRLRVASPAEQADLMEQVATAMGEQPA
jgi:hypothetical protein